MIRHRVLIVVVACSVAWTFAALSVASMGAEAPPATDGRFEHPRLYFSSDDAAAVAHRRQAVGGGAIWQNLLASADWCREQPPRTEWIPTLADDPQYENLYDRFYAAMHDAAIVETLAFASALHFEDDDPYFAAAKSQLLAAADVWRHESENPPDAGKAYAVLRVVKSIAVGYDLLYDRLSESERAQVRDSIVPVLRAYFQFFQDPSVAGAGYNKHHGSVDAAPLGVAALALLGDVPEADAWLQMATEKHTGYLLTEALTPSGTNDQSSNFWASTLMYRIQFMDALRRVTGRDLFAEFPRSLPGQMALAAVAGPHPARFDANEPNRSVLFGPNYGQLNYWSPVLVFLAREQRRPIYQYLAAWDETLGTVQRTRFVTPTRKEELLFGYGPYAFLWYDPDIPAEVEPDLPRAFLFPEPAVNEAYLRESFEPGAIAVAMLKGSLVVHAGGRATFVDLTSASDVNKPPEPVEELLVSDDGRRAAIRCVGPKAQDVSEQWVELHRPGVLKVERHTSNPVRWWQMDQPRQEANSFVWPDGVRLQVEVGEIAQVDVHGYVESPVHFGGMKFADPCPHEYQTVEVKPIDGVVKLFIRRP
ncbi:MAG: DUF4962 domain-containing protein [Planctomycetaceae bacterium]|nr:DUF4962 domain-containing protein [Planctomycetaceae bacterium]